MTGTRGITEYHAGGGLTEFPEAAVLEPAPALNGWSSYLSHRAVRAMAASPKSGIVWIATWGGVLAWNRRDQYLYRRYSTEHGLAGTPACVTVDADDAAWVGHDEGGLSYFDGTRWWPHAHLREERIRAVGRASGGGVWAAGARGVYLVRRDGPALELAGGHTGCVGATALVADGDAVLVGSPAGLYRVSPRTGVERLLADLLEDCTALVRASTDAVWAGSSSGVVRVTDADAVRVEPDRGDSAVLDLAPARDGVWVLTRDAVARVRQTTWTTLSAPPPGSAPARAIVETPSDDYLWVGTDDLVSGVRARGAEAWWDPGLLQRHDEDALCNIGRCIVTTSSPARVWVGTGGGVFVVEGDGTWSFDSDVGDVRGLCVTPSGAGSVTVWMLAWPTGVVRTASSERMWSAVDLPPGLATALAAGVDGSAHVVVGPTLWRLDDTGPTVVAEGLPGEARALAQGADGTWSLATSRGVFRLDGGRWSLASGRVPGAGGPHGRLREPGAADVLVVADGVLWAGGSAGLWSRDADGWRRHDLRFGGRECRGPVTALAPSSDPAALWLGAGGRVLSYAPAQQEVRASYDRFDSGIGAGAVTGLAELRGVLWVVTRGGTSRLTLSPGD